METFNFFANGYFVFWPCSHPAVFACAKIIIKMMYDI